MPNLQKHTACLLLLLQLTCCCLQLTQANQDDENSKETNEIIPREAIQKLDYSVRQALLRAIDKLEKETAQASENENSQDSAKVILEEVTQVSVDPVGASTTDVPSDTKDEILEESTAGVEEVVPTVQFYTATFDEKNNQEQLLSSFIDRSKLWPKQTKTSLGSPVVVSANSVTPTPSNHQSARSIYNSNREIASSVSTNEISNDSVEDIKFEIRKSTKHTTTTTPRTTTTTRKSTTTTTTTTTTPRPTHNEDGENIELVDDIKIQEAPLVTAFTVDLDERGTTKKVVPLVHALDRSFLNTSPRNNAQYQPITGPTISKLNVLSSGSQLNSYTAAPTVSPSSAPPTQATYSTTAANRFNSVTPTESLIKVSFRYKFG